jgi:SAM-dependent methyltransferase
LRERKGKHKIIRKLELTLVNYLINEDNPKILEIGLGTGYISKLLIKKGKFTGLDISPEMIKKAKENLNISNILEGDILNLNLKNKYDTIVTIRVISHFNKTEAILALKNIHKSLEKSGKVIFNLENKSLTRRILRKIKNWGSTHTYQYSKKDIKEIIRKSGFEIQKIYYLDHSFIYPLHLLNKLLFNKLEDIIFKIELNLKEVGLMHNNFFIKCRKKSF